MEGVGLLFANSKVGLHYLYFFHPREKELDPPFFYHLKSKGGAVKLFHMDGEVRACILRQFVRPLKCPF